LCSLSITGRIYGGHLSTPAQNKWSPMTTHGMESSDVWNHTYTARYNNWRHNNTHLDKTWELRNTDIYVEKKNNFFMLILLKFSVRNVHISCSTHCKFLQANARFFVTLWISYLRPWLSKISWQNHTNNTPVWYIQQNVKWKTFKYEYLVESHLSHSYSMLWCNMIRYDMISFFFFNLMQDRGICSSVYKIYWEKLASSITQDKVKRLIVNNKYFGTTYTRQ
jgi:hypothetical protein